MCFLKTATLSTPCNHLECLKTLEVYNRANCMHLMASKQNQDYEGEKLKKMLKNEDHQINMYNQLQNQNRMPFVYGQSNFVAQHQSQNNAMQNSILNVQNIAQNGISNMNGVLNGINKGNSSFTCQNPCVEGQILGILGAQSTLLQESLERNREIDRKLHELMVEFQNFKNLTIKQNPIVKQVELTQNIQVSTPQVNERLIERNEISNGEELLSFLYPEKKEDFKYQLQLNNKLELPLYRERNFHLSVELQDMSGMKMSHISKMPISIALYSYESPPKCIDINTSGQKILKGYIERELFKGECRFLKIQIKEVTSHFRKGRVFMVVYPKMPTLLTFSETKPLDFTKIKPLIIENVIVKAKRLKGTGMFTRPQKKFNETDSTIVFSEEAKSEA